MIATKISVHFSNATENYEVGVDNVVSIHIQNNSERIRIEYEKNSGWDYKIIPLFMIRSIDLNEDKSST